MLVNVRVLPARVGTLLWDETARVPRTVAHLLLVLLALRLVLLAPCVSQQIEVSVCAASLHSSQKS